MKIRAKFVTEHGGCLAFVMTKGSASAEEERIIFKPKYNDQMITIGSSLPNNLKERI